MAAFVIFALTGIILPLKNKECINKNSLFYSPQNHRADKS